MTEPGRRVYIHATADVDPTAEIGVGTRVWNGAQIRERAKLGEDCVVGSGAYVDAGVTIGARVKIENAALIFAGAEIGDGVFVGPGATITNDRRPRAVAANGEPLAPVDWQLTPTRIGNGASIGAGAVIVAGADLGTHSMIGAGSVVTAPVADYALAYGNPARQGGWVCRCGEPLTAGQPAERAARDWQGRAHCPRDGSQFDISGGSCRPATPP
jgi:UDP-2-acetamido-3-amino-2,3-dideoxy-glucuronate N-acetyltransferase